MNERPPSGGRLILVRHGKPEVSADAPAAEWRLSPHGLARSRELARRLGTISARTIYASTERKAIETAGAIGEVLQVPVDVIDGIHEHDRRDTPLLDSAAFEASIRRLFRFPGECVFGRESADAAAARFRRTIARLTPTGPADDIIVVTHGTVMTLFLAASNAIEPFSFWRGLPMPCAALVRLPNFHVESIVTPDRRPGDAGAAACGTGPSDCS